MNKSAQRRSPTTPRPQNQRNAQQHRPTRSIRTKRSPLPPRPVPLSTPLRPLHSAPTFAPVDNSSINQHTLLPSTHKSHTRSSPPSAPVFHAPLHTTLHPSLGSFLQSPPSLSSRFTPPQPTDYPQTVASSMSNPSTTSSRHPQTVQKRTFLNAFFEKQRKMSWTLHRRKKMEMSADMLSRPTYRPGRTESMDLIQKEIHEVLLANNQHAKTTSLAQKIEQNREIAVPDDVPVSLKTLFPRQRLFIYYLKLQDNAHFLFPVYLGLWFATYGTAYYHLKTKPFEYQRKFMDLLDISAFQTFHQVIDSNPAYVDALLAFGITSATDLLRLPLLFLATSLFYNKDGIVTLTPEAYQRVRYRYEFEERPEPELDVSRIDPSLHHGLTNLPGTNPIPRGDYYGRDRQRDLIPKDRIDLEYVLHSWQRTNAVRTSREAFVLKRHQKKKRIAGPRWAKSGIGIFKRF